MWHFILIGIYCHRMAQKYLAEKTDNICESSQLVIYIYGQQCKKAATIPFLDVLAAFSLGWCAGLRNEQKTKQVLVFGVFRRE